MSTIVFRIEHSQTMQGPYHGHRSTSQPSVADYLDDAHYNDMERPIITDECIEFARMSDEFVCGCPSLDDLLWWFDGFLNELHIAGYVLRIYEATGRVLMGKRQCAFDRRVATKLDELALAG